MLYLSDTGAVFTDQEPVLIRLRSDLDRVARLLFFGGQIEQLLLRLRHVFGGPSKDDLGTWRKRGKLLYSVHCLH